MPTDNRTADTATRRLPLPEFLTCCRLLGSAPAPCPRMPRTPGLPLVDVRSPGEFRQGHIPGAVNLPLMSDEERSIVGTLYKQKGRDEAVFRGLGLVGPKLEFLARSTVELAGEGKEVAMYCSRGGMRSASMSWLFAQAGVSVTVLEGGYKAFRRHVLSLLEGERPGEILLRVLGGRTGSGKTEVLHCLADRGEQVIDLEGMARHRGSAFGALPNGAQPTCEHFTNRLALALDQCDATRPVWIEDESENIGTINQPKDFFRLLRSSPLVVLEIPRPLRLKRVLDEYGDISKERMGDALNRISKRLGGVAHKHAHALLDNGDLPALAEILLDYYDRAYDKQIHMRAAHATVRAQNTHEAVSLLLK